jgi:hypothetical protein
VGKSGRANNNARLAALKAEQARQARRQKVLLAGGTVGLVVLIIAALVIAKLVSSDGTAAAANALDATTLSKLTTVPTATFDKVGVGSATVFPKKVDGEAITADGKPRILYVGAEYCPYCALERYAVVTALSRFGTFSGLAAANSDPADGGAIDTLSFHGSSYTSKYVAFTGVETNDNKKVNGVYGTLDTLSDADQALFQKYNAPPYVEGTGGAIPWVYYAGKAITSGASVERTLLQGQTQAEIATALADPTSDIAKSVLGSANVLSAQVCALTGQQPAEVCTSAGVKAGAAKLQ